MFGLAVPEVERQPETFGILPENCEALAWFLNLWTLWRVTANGSMCFPYEVFIACARDAGVKRRDRAWILEDLRLLEWEYLAAVQG